MIRYTLLLSAALLLLAGCVTVEESPSSFPTETAVERGGADKGLEKTPKPVYEKVTVPLEVKKTWYFHDGVMDRYTVFTYMQDSSLVIRKETRNAYDELLEVTNIEYTGDFPAKELVYGSDSRLRSYQLFGYDQGGRLVNREYYNAGDSLQTRSVYEYDDNGNRIRWDVYGSRKNLLSRSEYVYNPAGTLAEIRILSPDGTPEEIFIYEYSGDIFIPVRQIRQSPLGKIVQIVEYRVQDDLILQQTTLGPEGWMEYRAEYEYGDFGQEIRESIYNSSGFLIEYTETDYIFREEDRLVQTPEEQK